MNKTKYTLILIVFLFISCAGLQSYYYKLEKYMTSEKYIDAESLVNVSKDTYGDKNKFLYHLDLAFVQHLSKNYLQSNDNFETAKQIYDENYTKSISAGAFSLFANDNVIPYYGHAYEMAYVNVFCALNYILQGFDNEAVVEARQVDNLFKKVNADSYGKAFYNNDPFVRYFMGIVYENAGYYNDAIISYKSALKNYDTSFYSDTKKEKDNVGYNLPVPKDLIYSLYKLYVKLGFSQEAENLRQKYAFALSEQYDDKSCGELIIVNYNGLAPKKIDSIIELSFFKAWSYFVSTEVSTQEQEQAEKVKAAVRAGFSDEYIKIAFPKYERFDNKISSFLVEVVAPTTEKNLRQKTISDESYVAADIGSLLISALQKENLAIYSKTIARAVGRYVLAKAVTEQVRQKESNDNTLSILTNSILNITKSLLEKADKRSWRTLPETINMTRLFLPEGEHTLNIKYLNSLKTTVYSEQISVEIKRNKKTFIITKSFKN